MSEYNIDSDVSLPEVTIVKAPVEVSADAIAASVATLVTIDPKTYRPKYDTPDASTSNSIKIRPDIRLKLQYLKYKIKYLKLKEQLNN